MSERTDLERKREQSKEHSISEEEFSDRDLSEGGIDDYSALGEEEVTRENFINLLIDSFSYSRGSEYIQRHFFYVVKG